jgi:nucleoside phosphorylase/tetratricopeptide (TPR) repeat protein
MPDILLVTATKVESKTVLQVFEQATTCRAQAKPIGDRIYFDLGNVNGARAFLVQTEMGAGGLGAALQTVQKGIDAVLPAAVIMVGIAFGVDESRQAIGDILVSENLRCYEPQRAGQEIIPRGDRPRSSPSLLNRLKSADLLWDGAKVRFGVVVTGEKLVDDIAFRTQVCASEREAIGGEMEGAGLYAACQDKKVDWILVKAICDWADGNKEHDRSARQQTAATNAASFVLHALQFAPFEGLDRVGEVAQPPHSSLPPQPFFFGREKELAIIADAILPDSRTWGALIDGPGGIGKTALAVRAAYVAPVAHYPRKAFLSAKVRELTPHGEQPLQDFMLPNYLALLSELAREMGDTELARVPENERANAVRRSLANQSALFVIDNIETFPEAEQVRLYQFLSRLPHGCKAIVTSRRRSDVDARAIRLDRMDQKDALSLIAELAKTNSHLAAATGPERQMLYEVSGGNPLLLRWTAAQLGRRGSQCRTVAEACAYLKKAPAGNDPLEYIFGDLLDTFTESETAVLAALTHFTQPAQVKWIADVAGLVDRQAQTALDDLADRALLVSDPGAHAFVLPPLAAMFLQKRRPEAVAKTGDRLADRVYALVLENGVVNERFPLLEAEWRAVDAALPRLARIENDRLQTLCRALDTFLDFSGHWDERLQLSQQAEETAVAANDFENAGWRAHKSGWSYSLRGQAAEVLSAAARAEGHWQKAKAGDYQQAAAILLRGVGHRLEKNYPEALADCRRALGLYRTFGLESESVAGALNSIAQVEELSGDYAAAERDYREALRIAKKVGYKEGEAAYTGNLSEVALRREDWPSAEQLAREALLLAEAVGRQQLIGNDAHRLATALARQGRGSEGLRYARRAVEILQKLRKPDDLEDAKAALRECEPDGSAATR